MSSVPRHVYFIAIVFAISSVYVSQEVGMALAQEGGPFPPPPPQSGEFREPPQQFERREERREFREERPEFREERREERRDDMREGKFEGEFKGQPGQPGQFGQFKPPQPGSMPGQPPQGPSFGNKGPNFGPQQKGDRQFDQREPSEGLATSDDGDAEFEKRQAEEEAREKARQKQQLLQMQKGMKQSLTGIKRMEQRIAAIEKAGMRAPEELTTLIKQVKDAVGVIQNASSLEDGRVEEAMDTLQSAGDELREWFPKLEQFAQMPRIMKSATTELRKAKTIVTRTKSAAASLKGFDVSAQISEMESQYAALEAAYNKAQTALAGGDVEAAMETLQDEFFENVREVYQYEGMIRALKDMRRYMSNFDRFVAKAAKSKDEEVRNLAEDMKSRVAELRQAVGQKISDPEDLRDLVETVFEVQTQIEERAGVGQTAPQFQPQNAGSLPQGLDFSFGSTPRE